MPKRDQLLAALGRNLRKRHEASSLTQEKLAELAGLDAASISGIDRDLRQPRIGKVTRIAVASVKGGDSELPQVVEG